MPLKGYIEPIDVCKKLGWDYGDADLLAEVTMALEFVEEAVDSFCHTSFENQTATTKLYDGGGMPLINLGFYLRELTSVRLLDINGATIETLTDVKPGPVPLKREAYCLIERSLPAENNSTKFASFPVGKSNVAVLGDWGFINCPEMVRTACAFAVKHAIDLREHNSTIKFEGGFGRQIQLIETMADFYLPEPSRKMLEKYINSNLLSE